MLHLLLSNAAAMNRVASSICVLDMSGADLHYIWPEVQLDDCEARLAATLAGGAFVSDA